MAEPAPAKDRLLPSLLDRLTDDDPGNDKEAAQQRTLRDKEFRDRVRRDLEWLLNTSSLETLQDLVAYPEVAHSVVNFGVRGLSGNTASKVDAIQLERRLRQTIIDFEPRILPNTLKITVQTSDQFNHNALSFDIEGDLWMLPTPLHLLLKSEMDLETGAVTVRDKAG